MPFYEVLQPGYLGFLHDRTSKVLDLLNRDGFTPVSHPDVPRAVSGWTGSKTRAPKRVLMHWILASKPVMKQGTDYAALLFCEIDMAGHLEDAYVGG
jgi:hypothetical protein